MPRSRDLVNRKSQYTISPIWIPATHRASKRKGVFAPSQPFLSSTQALLLTSASSPASPISRSPVVGHTPQLYYLRLCPHLSHILPTLASAVAMSQLGVYVIMKRCDTPRPFSPHSPGLPPPLQLTVLPWCVYIFFTELLTSAEL